MKFHTVDASEVVESNTFIFFNFSFSYKYAKLVSVAHFFPPFSSSQKGYLFPGSPVPVILIRSEVIFVTFALMLTMWDNRLDTHLFCYDLTVTPHLHLHLSYVWISSSNINFTLCVWCSCCEEEQLCILSSSGGKYCNPKTQRKPWWRWRGQRFDQGFAFGNPWKTYRLDIRVFSEKQILEITCGWKEQPRDGLWQAHLMLALRAAGSLALITMQAFRVWGP